jgi:hypothetical protein
MIYTQIVCFELGSGCPYAAKHAFCPAHTRKPMTEKLEDARIEELVRELYDVRGFTGLIGWHFYCEPMACQDRMWPLMERLKGKARFLLWSNAERHLTSADPRLAQFEKIYLSLYNEQTGDEHRRAVDNVRAFCKDVETAREHDDGRLREQPFVYGPCLRPFLEMDVAYDGTVHACCHAWKWDVGDLKKEKLEVVEKRWRAFRRSLFNVKGKPAMSALAPEGCRLHCGTRYGIPDVDAAIAERARKYIRGIANG